MVGLTARPLARSEEALLYLIRSASRPSTLGSLVAALLASSALALGCSSTSNDTHALAGGGGSGGAGSIASSSSGPPPSGPDCATLAPTCFASQQGCVEANGAASCVSCDDGQYAAPSGTCEPIPGTAVSHDFPDQTVQAGEEQLGNCRSWTLGNDTDLYVNAVELSQSEQSHHSNWTWVPEDSFPGADGIWPCGNRSYDFYSGVAAGGVVYSQSTQAVHEVQKFPDGAVVRIPAHSKLISDIHLLNTTGQAVTGHAHLTLYSLAEADVKIKLGTFHLEYDALDIPPHSSVRYTGQCSVAAAYEDATKQPFSPSVYYLLPHTHTLATAFFARVLGGPNDGSSLLDLGSYSGEAHGRAFDPPISLAGADGIEFGCQYTNPRSDSVGWGFGDQEMCELFGFADLSSFLQARVNVATPNGDDGSVELFDGPCSVELPK